MHLQQLPARLLASLDMISGGQPGSGEGPGG